MVHLFLVYNLPRNFLTYRTISRHLNTKKATTQKNTLVYFFSAEISTHVLNELLINPVKANMDRSEIWVYKVDNKGGLGLIPNQPFKTKREALRVLGLHSSVLNKHIDSSIECKGYLIFSSPQTQMSQ